MAANSFNALRWEEWASEVQENLFPSLTAFNSGLAERISMSGADVLNKPYNSRPTGQSYTPGTSFTVRAQESVNEQLTVNTAKVVPVYVDKIDEVLSNYDIRSDYTSDIVEVLSTTIDATALSEYANAGITVDAGDVGGTAGDAIDMDPSKVRRAMTKASVKLDNNNVPTGNRKAILSPSTCGELALSIAAQDMGSISEDAFNKGYVGMYFGFMVYKSSNLTFTARWTPDDNPSDGDTVTYKGVVITFKTALTGGNNEIKIGAATANTLDNMVALFNDPDNASESSNYSAIEPDDAWKFQGMEATDGTTYIGVTHVGGGEVSVAASASADVWSLQRVHNVLGQAGAISVGVAELPKLGFNQKELAIPGSGYIVGSIDFGTKVFKRMQDRLVAMPTDGSNF